MINNENDMDEEKLEEEYTSGMNRDDRRKLKKMLKANGMSIRDLIKKAQEKTKDTTFMSNANGKSAWCMNNMHFKCKGYFLTSKKTECECSCHKNTPIELKA